MFSFDFSKFPTQKSFSNPIVLNLAGMAVEQKPPARFVDADGNPQEFNQGEYKNEEVNFIFYNGNNLTSPSSAVGSNNVLKGYVSTTLNLNPLSNVQLDEVQYFSGSSAEPLRNFMKFNDNANPPAPPTLFTQGKSIVNGQQVDSTYQLGIIARHKLMRGADGVRIVQSNRDILAGLGLWSFGAPTVINGTTYYGQTFNQAYLSNKDYLSRTTAVRNSAAELDSDVIATPYLSYIVNNVDLNASGISRNDIWSDLYGINFINKKNTEDPEGLFAPYTDDDITPNILSVTSAFQQWYTSASELYDSLVKVYSEIESSLALIPSTVQTNTWNNNWSVSTKIRHSDDIGSTIGNLQVAIAASLALGPVAGGAIAASLSLILSNLQSNYSTLTSILNQVLIYEHYTNQTIFPDNFFYTSYITNKTSSANWFQQPITSTAFKYNKINARAIVPVDMGQKVKRIKNLTKNKIVTDDAGIRYALIQYIDTTPFNNYRKNNTIPGNINTVDAPIVSIINNVVTISKPLSFEEPLPKGTKFQVTIINTGFSVYDTNLPATWINQTSFTIYPETGGGTITAIGTVQSATIPFKPTQPNNNPTDATVYYKMPGLPSDTALRELALNAVKPFIDPLGYTIFQQTSRKIEDMVKGMPANYYNQVAFLLRVLQEEFGASQVSVIDTMRSWADQQSVQSGGEQSNMLSWHNYGYAIRIIIRGRDDVLIKDATEEYFRLFDIAEAFVKGSYAGELGEPLNVVWCGQLATNPSIFDWEFLPIGVEHRDASKFRQSIYNQRDPMIDNAWVNVTKNKWVLEPGFPAPTTPFVYKDSDAYRNAITINNEKYVNPKSIINYPNVDAGNLPVSNIEQFIFMVINKQWATGTDLIGRKSISEWKIKNPISFDQLVIFNSFTGNYSTARALLAGDFYNLYYPLVLRYAKRNPVLFCKNVLGAEYYNVQLIPIDDSQQSFISVADGRYHTKVTEVKSMQPISQGNLFGQEQIDRTTSQLGIWLQNGTWLSAADGGFLPITTPEPVITGYIPVIENGVKVGYEATNTLDSGDLHERLANDIVSVIILAGDSFLNLETQFMYDNLNDSDNTNSINVLVNEFGVIKPQLIVSFEKMRIMYSQLGINTRKKDNTLTVRGALGSSQGEVWEKLVSTAELGGPRKAVLTREKPKIEPLIDKIEIQNAIKGINKLTGPSANDIL